MKKWEKYTKEQVYLFFDQSQSREQFLKLFGYNNYNSSNFKQIMEAYPELPYDKFSKHLKTKYELSGQTFGRLTAIKKDLTKKRETYWICQCQCGNLKSIRQQSLLNGNTLSCGCLQKEKISEIGKKSYPTKTKAKDITGEIFNTLQAIKPTEERQNGHIIWECKCIKCGAIKKCSINNLIGLSANCNCNRKNSKGEEKIQSILEELQIPYEAQYTFKDLKGERNWKLRYDFALFDNDKQIIALIEYQGKQHFEPIEFWGGTENYESIKKRDDLKLQYAQEHHIPLYTISYFDYDKIDKDFILKILTNSKKIYEKLK